MGFLDLGTRPIQKKWNRNIDKLESMRSDGHSGGRK